MRAASPEVTLHFRRQPPHPASLRSSAPLPRGVEQTSVAAEPTPVESPAVIGEQPMVAAMAEPHAESSEERSF
ncbi:MAG: hypothetical protein HYY04_07320 [Chloroflexi bacterium]|nr:hypothetical protein [Chloroflexota bacterium]